MDKPNQEVIETMLINLNEAYLDYREGTPGAKTMFIYYRKWFHDQGIELKFQITTGFRL